MKNIHSLIYIIVKLIRVTENILKYFFCHNGFKTEKAQQPYVKLLLLSFL